jgi:uncharacterized membrane protein YtjA (UPF0391 family)
MLKYAIIFLLVAIVAGFFGFGQLEGTAALIAQVLFVIFLILFIVGLIRGKK